MDYIQKLIDRGFIDENCKITSEGIEVLIHTPQFLEKVMPTDLAKGLELHVKNGTINTYSIPVYDENYRIVERNMLIWTECDNEESLCALTEKEDLIALRDYINRFLEEFFD